MKDEDNAFTIVKICMIPGLVSSVNGIWHGWHVFCVAVDTPHPGKIIECHI